MHPSYLGYKVYIAHQTMSFNELQHLFTSWALRLRLGASFRTAGPGKKLVLCVVQLERDTSLFAFSRRCEADPARLWHLERRRLVPARRVDGRPPESELEFELAVVDNR